MKISLITVCKNSEEHIEKAIQSVFNQTYNDIEYIIIDGLSSDKTLDIVNRYKDNIDIIISESDTGIYNAMNKGLKYTTGDIVYFLNSDDYFYDNNVLSDIAAKFEDSNDAMIVYGNVIMTDKDKKKLIGYNKINRDFFYKNTICHQAIFAKKTLFDKIGVFNEKYIIHADVDWLMRVFFKIGNSLKHIDRTISVFSNEGFCSNPIWAEKYKFDRQEISAKYFFKARYRLQIKKILKFLRSLTNK